MRNGAPSRDCAYETDIDAARQGLAPAYSSARSGGRKPWRVTYRVSRSDVSADALRVSGALYSRLLHSAIVRPWS